jgi:hypothetical protein
MTLFPYYADFILRISTTGTPSAHKKWISALCSSLVQMKLGVTMFMEKKLVTEMYHEVHTCTTMVGEKQTMCILS